MKRFSLLFLFFAVQCSSPNVYETNEVVPNATNWSYHVEIHEEMSDLLIRAQFPENTGDFLKTHPDSDSFVRDIFYEENSQKIPLSFEHGGWRLPQNRSKTGYVSYRFQLSQAIVALKNREFAEIAGGVFQASPSWWLVYPKEYPKEHSVKLKVKTPSGLKFVSGLFPDPNEQEGVCFEARHIYQLPYAVFGRFTHEEIRLTDGTVLEVVMNPEEFHLSKEAFLEWVKTSGESVARYFGKFPVPRALVILRPHAGKGIVFGMAKGNSGASISIWVGVFSQPEDLKTDWVMVHEMSHMAFPSVGPQQRWIEEGMATYVEAVARRRSGLSTPKEFWYHLASHLSYGLPEKGDSGLDFTPTWGRIYWGGALFCFLADIEIRKRTQNRLGLEHALQGIVQQGGTILLSWPITEAFSVGDQAVGFSVLTELYDQMKATAVQTPLTQIFKDLGLEWYGEQIRLNDSAPLAPIRRAIAQEENN